MDHSPSRQQFVAPLLVIAGTVVRAVYGWVVQPWTGAPDQLAWGLLLDDARRFGLRWDQLAHWPHEGASALVAWPAFVMPETWLSVPALSWSALLFDTAGRAVQVWLALRLFGRSAGLWFAAFMVFAVPGLVPWGTVNFGLHAVSAFWPFVLLAATLRLTGGPSWWRLGVVLGLALTWSYDAVPFAVVGFIAGAIRAPTPGRTAEIVKCVAACLITLTPHLVIRLTVDHGFGLEDYSMFAVRDAAPSWPGPLALSVRFGQTLIESVPGATLLPPLLGGWSDVGLRWVWVGMAYAGLWGAVAGAGNNEVDTRRAARWAAAGVAAYLVVYTVSPFHVAALRAAEAVAYRHLAFVLPIVAALALGGTRARRRGLVLRLGLIGLGAAGTVALTAPSRRVAPDWEAAGWILARKLGHDPARVERVVRGAEPATRPSLWRGVGWGMTAVLLSGVDDPSAPEVDRLVGLVAEFDPSARGQVEEGVRRAFAPGVSPTLARPLEPLVDARLRALSEADGTRR